MSDSDSEDFITRRSSGRIRIIEESDSDDDEMNQGVIEMHSSLPADFHEAPTISIPNHNCDANANGSRSPVKQGEEQDGTYSDQGEAESSAEEDPPEGDKSSGSSSENEESDEDDEELDPETEIHFDTENIEFIDPPPQYEPDDRYPPLYEEKIVSAREYSIAIYKCSERGGRKYYIHRGFVNLLIQANLSYVRQQRYVLYFFSKIEDYQKVIQILNLLQISRGETDRSIALAVKALSRYYNINLREAREIQNENVEQFLEGFSSLQEYQIDGIRKAINRRGRCILADEAGLGKRVQGIISGLFYRSEWPMLIICGTSSAEHWKSALIEQGITSEMIFGICRIDKDYCRLQFKKFEVVIAGYTSLQDKEIAAELKEQNFKVLILDESERIKHRTSKTTTLVRHLLKRAKRRFLLTSNPATGVPHDLFQQLHALDRISFPDASIFADQYCGIVEFIDPDGKVCRKISRHWRDARNTEELGIVLKNTLMIRRFRSKLFQLPSFKREKVIVEFQADESTRRLLGALTFKDSFEHYLDMLSKREAIDPGEELPPNFIFKWFKQSGVAKLMGICAYLNELDYSTHKVLIYARHVKVLEGIQNLLKRKNVGHVLIRGNDKLKRDEQCKKFNSNQKVRVALLNGSISLNSIQLPAADLIIFAELYWVPDFLFRNENRSYRLGVVKNAQKDILVKYLVVNDLLHIDNVLWDMISGKMNLLVKMAILLEDDAFVEKIPQVNFTPDPGARLPIFELPNLSSNEEGSDSEEFEQPSEADDSEESSVSPEPSSEESGAESHDGSYNGHNGQQQQKNINNNQPAHVGNNDEEEDDQNQHESREIVGVRASTRGTRQRILSDEEENFEIGAETDQSSAENFPESKTPATRQRSIRIHESSDESDEDDEECSTATEDFVEREGNTTSEDEDYTPRRNFRHRNSRKRKHVQEIAEDDEESDVEVVKPVDVKKYFK